MSRHEKNSYINSEFVCIRINLEFVDNRSDISSCYNYHVVEFCRVTGKIQAFYTRDERR